MKNIINELWEYAEKLENKSLYNYLNKDNLGAFIEDNGIFWMETTAGGYMPNYIYEILKKWGKSKNLTYLYDLPTK